MENVNSLKNPQCLICKSRDVIELYPADIDPNKVTFTYQFTPESQKTFRVVRCNKCTHAFCFPLPKDMYKNYEDVVDEEYLRHSYSRMLTGQAVLNFICCYLPLGKLLDVGCATGDFLVKAKEFGYSVEGLELCRWSSLIARNRGIKVYNDTISELSNKFKEKYDVITLLGVIEHLESPLSELHHIHSLLKPGGILVIWTGDLDGMISRFLSRKWWYWQGQHIQYFTHKSLNHLAELTGFEHIVTKRYPIAATYDQLSNSLNRFKFGRYFTWLLKPLFMIKPVFYLRLPGEMLWLGSKKSKK